MRLRLPISFQFSLIIVVVLVGQLLASIWVASDRINKRIIQEKELELAVILEAFHQTYDVLSHHDIVFDAKEMLTLINEDPDLESALIVNDNNRVVSSLDNQLTNQTLDNTVDLEKFPLVEANLEQSRQNKETIIWHDKNQEIVHAISPIETKHPGDPKISSGSVYIRLNMTATEQMALERMVTGLTPIFAFFTLTALFITWYFNRYIHRRINNLRDSANTFTESGELSLATPKMDDELSDLHHSLLRLMEQAKKKSEIEQAKAEVENAKAQVEHEMKVSQEQSKKLAQQLALHWQNTPMGIIEWNKDFEVTAWNPAAEKIFGYSAEEAIGKHARFIVPDEAKEHVDFVWHELLTNKESVDSSNLNITKDGRIITCDWVNTPLITDEGDVIGAASFAWDNSSEHEAIKSLVKREQEQSEILNSMTDGVISIDEKGMIKSFNQAAENLFGYRAYEMIDKNVKILMAPEDAQYHDKYLATYDSESLSKVIGAGREVLAKHKGGELIPIHLSVSELPSNADEKRRFIGSCHDLRQKKQQEEILRRSQKMDSLGKLTGGIAHDFNNILGVVTGYTELLLPKLKDQPDLAKYAEEIKTASKRGARLTSKLLASSKKKRHINEKTDINQVIQNQQKMLKQTLPPNVKLLCECQHDLWSVELDAGDLEDAILNLCINAMHAMNEGGKLCLFTYNRNLNKQAATELHLTPGDYVVLCVTDTGTGMDSNTQERIFEPFYSTKGDQGTGLGLSQVFGFIERSHAGIKVESAQGEGSQFSLYFPRLAESIDSSAATSLFPQTNGTTAEKGKERILVVDDETSLRNLCVEILSGHGYQIQSASSGEEALELLKSSSFDLLLSDIVMPSMDGYELADKARELQPNIKIQLTSGYDPEQHKHYGDSALRTNLITKPYTPFILLKQIRRTLDS